MHRVSYVPALFMDLYMLDRRMKIFYLCLISLFFIRTADAVATDKHLKCDDTIFKIQTSMFQIEAIETVNKNDRAFCTTDEPELVLLEKSQRKSELWCVKYFFITPDTRPYLKTAKMLNYQSRQLYNTEYIFVDGDWHVAKRETTACSETINN